VFAFFNLGAQEIVILLVLGGLLSTPLFVVLFVLFVVRRSAQAGGSGAPADLRAQVERPQKGSAGQGAAADRPRG